MLSQVKKYLISSMVGLIKVRDKMKIILPLYFIKTGRVGGAESMIYNLIVGFFGTSHTINIYVSNLSDLDQNFVTQCAAHKNIKISVYSKFKNRFVSEQWLVKRRDLQADMVVFPNYFTPLYISKGFGRVVTVIHDAQFRVKPEYFSWLKKLFLRFSHRLTMVRANQIIVISNFIKQQLMGVYGKKYDKKLTVIYNPINWGKFSMFDNKHPLDGQLYLLTVAAHYPHKNIKTIIAAFADILKHQPTLKLVLVGQLDTNLVSTKAISSDIRALLDKLILNESVIMTGYVDDRALSTWYHYAKMFLFPSLFEGFGMPPVEALGLGIPTLTTRCGSIFETTCGLAQYVDDPLNTDEWTQKILQMLSGSLFNDKRSQAVIREKYDSMGIANQYIRL